MSKIFFYKLSVKSDDLDELKHVNNEVYLRWLMEAAMGHSEALGFDMSRFIRDGAGFVVRQHVLDYLGPAFLGDELEIETWIETVKNARTERKYILRRPKDQKILLEAKTLWVYVSFETGMPLLIPKEISTAFGR